MKRTKTAFLAILFAASPLFAQTAAITNYCLLGAKQAITSGLDSTNYLQGVIPSCTVTVYLTGTTTLATIYADKSSTALTNPFTADVDGSWLIFAAVNQGYDVVLSGGISPNVYPSPVTLTDVFAGSDITVTGGISGSGTTGYIPVFTGTNSLGNSGITQTGSGTSQVDTFPGGIVASNSSTNYVGIQGEETSGFGIGVQGYASGTGTGISGYSRSGTGIYAQSDSGTALQAESNSRISAEFYQLVTDQGMGQDAIYAESYGGAGIEAVSNAGSAGIMNQQADLLYSVSSPALLIERTGTPTTYTNTGPITVINDATSSSADLLDLQEGGTNVLQVLSGGHVQIDSFNTAGYVTNTSSGLLGTTAAIPYSAISGAPTTINVNGSTCTLGSGCTVSLTDIASQTSGTEYLITAQGAGLHQLYTNTSSGPTYNFTTGALSSTSFSGSGVGLTDIPDSALATQAANTVLGALTATTPSPLAVPSCSGAANALTWTSGTGFGCNTISSGGSGTVNGGTIYSPAYYAATGTAVSGVTPFTGLAWYSTSAAPEAATAANIESAFGSQTANKFLASPNGSAGTSTFRAIVAADITALPNQVHPLAFADMSDTAYTASQIVAKYLIPVAQTIPAGGSVTTLGVACTSEATLSTAATASTTFSIDDNGTSFGTIAFAASGTSGTFTISSAKVFSIGNVITFVGPSTADSTAAGLAVSLCSMY